MQVFLIIFILIRVKAQHSHWSLTFRVLGGFQSHFQIKAMWEYMVQNHIFKKHFQAIIKSWVFCIKATIAKTFLKISLTCRFLYISAIGNKYVGTQRSVSFWRDIIYFSSLFFRCLGSVVQLITFLFSATIWEWL